MRPSDPIMDDEKTQKTGRVSIQTKGRAGTPARDMDPFKKEDASPTDTIQDAQNLDLHNDHNVFLDQHFAQAGKEVKVTDTENESNLAQSVAESLNNSFNDDKYSI